METVMEGIYENGALKLLNSEPLQEHRRYRIFLEEIDEPEIAEDAEMAAEIARRTTTMPDGRLVVHYCGIFTKFVKSDAELSDSIDDALSALRCERADRLEAEMNEFFSAPPEK